MFACRKVLSPDFGAWAWGSVCLLLLESLAAWVASAGSARGAAPPSFSGPVKMWTGAIRAHEDSLSGVAVSSDGHTLATTSGESIALWDLRTGKLIRERAFREESYFLRDPVFVSGDR